MDTAIAIIVLGAVALLIAAYALFTWMPGTFLIALIIGALLLTSGIHRYEHAHGRRAGTAANSRVTGRYQSP